MLIILNPTDRDWTKHRYILWFDACGSTRIMIWANGLDSAIDEAVDYLADNAPGLLADADVFEEYNRLIANGMSEEEAQEGAEIDTTCAGNFGHYLNSGEWGIVAEDPSRATVKELTADGIRLAG